MTTTTQTTGYVPFSQIQSRDDELYQEWKKTGSKEAMSKLVDQLSPLIYSEVQRASGSLPPTALAAEAKKWTIVAIKNYDPTKGAMLSTHVTNYLQKVRRMNYKYQNAVRLPENLQLKYHEYNKHLTQLTEQLNRDPSDEELAHALGWKKSHVVKFKNSLYSDLIESASERPLEATQFNTQTLMMEHIVANLTPDEKFIFDNHDKFSSTEMAAKMKVNLNRYNYLKKKLIDKVRALTTDFGG